MTITEQLEPEPEAVVETRSAKAKLYLKVGLTFVAVTLPVIALWAGFWQVNTQTHEECTVTDHAALEFFDADQAASRSGGTVHHLVKTSCGDFEAAGDWVRGIFDHDRTYDLHEGDTYTLTTVGVQIPGFSWPNIVEFEPTS